MEEILNEESVGQFSIKELFKELKKSILFIIATTLFFTALGGVVGRFFVKTQYTSTATMIIKTLDEKTTLADAEKLATATASFLSPKNDYIYQFVETTFNSRGPKKRVTIKELKESLFVTVDSMMINLEYTSSNDAADSILNLIMDQLTTYTKGESFYGCELSTLSQASEVTNDSTVKVFKFMIIFFIIGGLVSAAVVFLKVLLKDTYSDKEALELDVGVDVLVEIAYCANETVKEVE